MNHLFLLDLLPWVLGTLVFIAYMIAGIFALIKLDDCALSRNFPSVLPNDPIRGITCWSLWPALLLWWWSRFLFSSPKSRFHVRRS